jgi:hypothetical protein
LREIIQIHRDDRADAMDQHGGDHVRVMNLLAATFNVGEQPDQTVGQTSFSASSLVGAGSQDTSVRAEEPNLMS